MKLTALGKIAIFLVVIGAAVGGLRVWNQFKGGHNPAFTESPGSANAPGSAPGTPPGPAAPADPNDVVLLTSPSKKGWLNDEVAKFNATGRSNKVRLRFLETREAMHGVLAGKEAPAMWSPSSVIWADRLTKAWGEKHSGTLIDTSDPMSYRAVLRTPMVFLTTRSKAGFLRGQLSGPSGWANLRDLNLGHRKTPWGRIRWAHADPLNANSGMLTLALILADYANRTGQSASIESVAKSAGFTLYLQELERGLAYDTAVEKGTSALTKSFTEDTSRYDFITTYESSALDAALKDSNLAVIYPSPTAVAESALVAFHSDWVTPAQKETADAFLQFVVSPSAVADGVKEHFRPVLGGGASLDGAIAAAGNQGFQQTYASIELPPYEALNAAAYSWRINIAHKPVD